MTASRFAVLGAGFWAQYQLAAWSELDDARCVAVCDPVIERAQTIADRFGVPATYTDPAKLMAEQSLDFVDIISSVDTHRSLAELAARNGLDAICQKPLAMTLGDATAMWQHAQSRGTRLFVHENWRWQRPIRELKKILDSGSLGKAVRARIDYANSFPVFDNQPALKQLDRFILTDIGVHLLDAARFLFGEVSELYCQTRQMRDDIAGEDVATVTMRSTDELLLTCNMSYASRWEFDHFPQTMVFVEGTQAGVSLGANCELRIYDKDGCERHHVPPPEYDWAHPEYSLVHSSMVDCHRNLLSAIRGEGDAETTASDNLKTLALVFAAYDSAESGQVVSPQ